MSKVIYLKFCEVCGSDEIAIPTWINKFGKYTEVDHVSKYDWECYCYNCEKLVCHTMNPTENKEVA